VSLHVAPVPNCEGSSSQQLEALRDELGLWKAKAETFEARMQDALARAEQADARLERIAAECHQDKDEMHKQMTALEVTKETACTREQEAIRRAEEAEVRNAHLVETLAVFQSEVAALKELAERSAEPARVPVPLGEEIAAEERAGDNLKMREGKTYMIKSVMTGTVAKVNAIGQCLWAGRPSGGDDEKVCHPIAAFIGAYSSLVDRSGRSFLFSAAGSHSRT
jgi:chromosome segregation ATPase